MYDTILVATDGSDAANRAVEHALDLSATFDATLHAISIVDTRRYGDSMLAGSEGVLPDLEARATEHLQEVSDRADVDVVTEVRYGRPHEEIDAYANSVGADLVVLGNRGLGLGGDVGSTAERVVRHGNRPTITA